ncbi:hypothetical protein ABBQ38_003893 [Trebouxia sp. C0009 RCD-2024]
MEQPMTLKRLDKIYTKDLAEVGYVSARGQPGCSTGVLIGGHYGVSKHGFRARCDYFVKCHNCKEILAGRDFATHTGVHMQLHWRCSLRVLDNARNPSIKEWVRDKSKAVSAGYPALGTHLCVYWPTEQAWFAGCLTAYDAQEGLSKISYDDGDEEWLHLVMESYMISTADVHKQTSRNSEPHGTSPIDLCSSDSEAEQELQHASAPLHSHGSPALVIKQEPHPYADSAIVVEQAPWISRCAPTVAPAPPNSCLVPAHAQPATPAHGLASSCPGTSAAHHPWPQPRRKRQKTAEPHQLCQSSNDHPSACPTLHLTAAPQLPPSNTARQSKPSVCKPPMGPSMLPMGQSSPDITVTQHTSSDPLHSSTHRDAPVLQSEDVPARLQRHASPSLTDGSDAPACLQQETYKASLQLAVLPPSSLNASAAAAQPAPRSNNKLLELLQTSFASGIELSTEARQEALQDLVSSLTDPITTARFYAVLDRQSRCEVEHSLERWHSRVAFLFQTYQTTACAEVCSSMT